jgi:CrcB protein
VSFVLVFLGGALGAPARYLVDRFIQSRRDAVFPLGTLSVNLVGSFILGGLAAAARQANLPAATMTALGTGFCGGLTTFSTFSFETIRLVEEGSVLEATANVGISMLGGVLGALLGYALLSVMV